jgi:hypothetical protein
MNKLQHSRNRTPPLRVPTTIAFRVDEQTGRALAERAARLGVSPHNLAHHLVVFLFHEADHHAELRDALIVLNENMVKLRGDLATVAKALLAAAGKVEPQEADAWVKKVFN